LNKDEIIRQQRDNVDWEGLEREVKVSSRSKADRIVAQLPACIKVSRTRADDALFSAQNK
jgi:hypothetical protein